VAVGTLLGLPVGVLDGSRLRMLLGGLLGSSDGVELG
jgi:hypothetical protein